MVRKILFCSEFPLSRNSAEKKKKKGNYKAFCFSSKRNNFLITMPVDCLKNLCQNGGNQEKFEQTVY